MAIHNQLVNPKKLHVLSVVAATKNITQAAQQLCLSQPALSNNLSSLEQHFECKLYEVIGREVLLTEAGKCALNHWEKIETCYKEMNADFEAVHQGQKGEISIAMVSTAKYYLAGLIKAFNQSFPKVEFTLDIKERGQIIDDIIHHRKQIGILTEAPLHPELNRVKLGRNPLVFICSPLHELASINNISFKTLSKYPVVTREPSAQITQNLYKLFENNQASPNIAFSINSTEAIKEAVIENIGIALVPIFSIQRELKSGEVIAINFNTQSVSNDWYLVNSLNKKLLTSTKKFIENIQTYFKDQ
tara:strand:+ start:2317 stop:3225 length:909 start_codon:yes stop_codon:yes gene_type:complete